MDQKAREALQKKILKRYKLHLLQYSRFKRFLSDPLRTLPYYVMQWFAYRKPYKVSYKTLWGPTMRFYLPEGSHLYYYGFFEANLTNFFLRFVKRGDVFFDIGAHVGTYTTLASVLVEETGHVVAFEPTPRTFESLRESTRSLKNVEIHNAAILDKDGEIEFFDYGPKYSAFNSFKPRVSEGIFFKDTVDVLKVQALNIDAFCEKNNLHPTLIKIDAEGSEYLILESMGRIIERDRPFVTIEVSGEEEWVENCKKSIAFLLSRNYKCFEIKLDGTLAKHTPKDMYGYDNLLFAHDTKVKELKDLFT